MPTIVESVYIPDEKVVYETCSRTLRWLQLGMTVFFLYQLIRLIPSMLFYFDLTTVFLLAVSIGCPVFLWVLPVWKAKQTIKTLRWFYDGKLPEYRITCTEARIECLRGGVAVMIPYEKITKVLFLKRSIVLQAGGYTEILLPHDAYTVGSREQLLDLLRTQCPNLKLPPWNWA